MIQKTSSINNKLWSKDLSSAFLSKSWLVTLLKMQALGSGSNGNCFAINTRAGTILIDAGISRSRIISGLKELNIDPNTIIAVLITHAHSDHIIGLPVLSSTINFTVISTPETIEEIRKKSILDPRYEKISNKAIGIQYGGKIQFGGYVISIIPAFHDIVGSCGFQVEFNKQKLCYTTDTARISDPFQEMMRESEYIVIESNHDRKMLENSRRPAWLKRRIRETHLSNDETMKVLKEIISSRTKMIALAHLSGACNSPIQVIKELHRYHLESDETWDWVVCSRSERSSLISQIRHSLTIEGGLNNRILPDLELFDDLRPPKTDLNRYW